MLVSIVIATYNSAKTLRRCFDSIIPQLKEDCELIVIDGGSKDGSLGIINEYTNSIAYTISEPDKGVYDAWNKAIVKSHGEWITFIGSDDKMLPGALDLYRKFLELHGSDYDIVTGKVHFVSEDGKLIKDLGEPFDWLKLVKRKYNLAHPGMLHNRKCFERFGMFDLRYKICGDTEFLQRLGPDVKAGFIDEFLVNMQIGGLSGGWKTFWESFLIRYRQGHLSKVTVIFMYFKFYCELLSNKIKNTIRC